VTDCLGETASATAKRECEVSMANIEVDFLILPTVRRLGEQWNWSIKALSPAQGAAQVWGGDQRVGGDAAEAAYDACDALGREFACAQGVAQACVGSGFGAGPLLTNSSQGAGETASPARGRSRVAVSALDVFDVTPSEVSVWIDGKEAGTSANQVTGIPPGDHEVTLKATGYFDQSQRLLFEAGKPAVLRGIRLKRTTASLIVSMTVPSEATVLVGGRERGRSGASLSGIAPGATEVVIRASGYRERREQVSFIADEEARLDRVALEPLPATIIVTANIMGADVLVDGQVVGETTGEDDVFEVSYTSKLLELRRDGYRPFSQSLVLQRGGQLQVRVTMARTAAPPAPKPVAVPPRSVPAAVVAPPVASAKQGSWGSGPGWLLWTGLAAGVGATSGMAAVCGGFAACKVESSNDAATVDALRIAAFGGFSLAATGLLWSWLSDGSSSAEQVQKESGRLQVGIGLGQVQMEVAW
jgi:hypothetical protein